MRTTAHNPLVLLLAVLFVILGAGCSPQAKLAGHLERAHRHLQQERYDAAEIEYRNALRIEPQHPEAFSGLASLYFDQGRIGGVYPFLLRARELDPNNLEVRIRLGMFLHGVGKTGEATDEALFVLEHQPQHPQAALLLADAAVAPGDISKASERLQQLLTTGSTAAPVHVALGQLALRQRRLAEARDAFERARALDPKFAPVHLGLAAVCAAEGNLDGAEEAFANAAALSPLRSPVRIRQAQFSLQRGHAEAARKIVTDITTRAPDFLPAWVLLAHIHATDRRFEECLVATARILARDGAHPEAMLISARARLASGETEKAVSELERAVKIYPKAPQILHQLALAYLAAGELGRAAPALNTVLQLNPDATAAALLLAEINLRQGNPGPAVATLQTLVRQHPELAQARLLLAQAYRAQGNTINELRVYQELQRAFPTNPEAPLLKGVALLQQKQKSEAKTAFEEALKLDPRYLPALEQSINIDLSERQFGTARARLEALIAGDKQSPSSGVYLLLARVHLAENHTAEGRSALLKAVDLDPQSAVGHVMLARLDLSSSQPEQALENLRLAIEKDPRNVAALLLSAAIHESRKDYARARDGYENLLSVQPTNVPALNNLAYLYSERFGEADKAFKLAQRARELQPREPHIADTLGWIVYKRGQYAWAVTLLSESAEKLPASAEAQFHLGMAHYRLGEEQSASAILERSVALGQDFAGVEQAREALSILAVDPRSVSPDSLAIVQRAAATESDSIALARLGGYHEHKGDLDRAADAFAAALRASPQNVNASLNMIRLHLRRGNTTKAMELAKEARKLAPDHAGVAHLLGRLAFDSGDHRWAVSLLQESVRGRPGDPDALFDFSMAAYGTGDIASAKTALESALGANANSFPRAADAQRLLEYLTLAARPTLEALPRVKSRLKEVPNDVPALMALAAISEKEGDRSAAKLAYGKALAQYPEFAPAKRNLVVLTAQESGEHRDALKLAMAARIAFPNDAELARAMGILLYRNGNYARARTLLQEGIRDRAADPELLFHLGMAQHHLNDGESSRKSLLQAIEGGLQADLAAEARRVLAASETKSNE